MGSSAINEEDIAEAFDHLDSDRSGYITSEDIRDFLGGNVSDEFLQRVIEESNSSGDGRVSHVEFLGLWTKRHDDKMKSELVDVQLRRIRRRDSKSSSSDDSYISFLSS